MCGIGGIIFWDGRPTDGSVVERLLKIQSHRGPDGQGYWAGDGAVLAHNRLAIIDVDAGYQPMLTDDEQFIIVYNGELYNFHELRTELEAFGHRFRTRCDTEVILKSYVQWGADCLQRFRGMFAFVIWDRTKRKVFAARDRVGIKPLFFYQGDSFFAFSSEIQGLLSFDGIPNKLSFPALDHYLHYQYIAAPLTIYKDVCKLLPAHYLLLSAKGPLAAPVPYWDVRFVADRSRSEVEWLKALDDEISQSVKLHLVSDVPFGAFLSGGIDSSSVVYHMSRYLEAPVKTYTIGFHEATYDEREYAGKVARFVGSDHHFEVVHPGSFNLLDDLLYKLVQHYGEPFADSSAIPTYFVSRLAGSHVKMVLSGDGGDELFAGYNTYTNILGSCDVRASKWKLLIARLFRSSINGSIARKARQLPCAEALLSHGTFYAYFRDDARKKLYKPETAALISEKEQGRLYCDFYERSRAKECLSALQYLDIKTYLPGDILTKVDVASMMHSLEVRVPLLDHKVIELAAQVPSELKIKLMGNGDIQKKYLLKKHADSLFPAGFFDRPKQGFGVPIDNWFGGKLFPEVQKRIMSKQGILGDLFNRDVLSELVSSPGAARNNSGRIWALVFLQAWAERFGYA